MLTCAGDVYILLPYYIIVDPLNAARALRARYNCRTIYRTTISHISHEYLSIGVVKIQDELRIYYNTV